MSQLSRRGFLLGSGAAAVTPAMALLAGSASAEAARLARHRSAPQAPPFFTAAQRATVKVLCARLIPSDDHGPGAIEAGVPDYLDVQLGGSWGAGERLYRSGPWQQGTPSQGYQLPFTPAELFRKALDAIDRQTKAEGPPLSARSAEQQDAYLTSLEAGEHDLDGIPSAQFFAVLWQMTLEGYFSDPAYGGNRDMLAWKMLGFPGAYADYYDLVDQHGIRVERPPMSIADAPAMAPMHHGPQIPAKL